jgi:hypothetical protein
MMQRAMPQDPLRRKRNSRVELIMLNEYVDDFNKNREAKPPQTTSPQKPSSH